MTFWFLENDPNKCRVDNGNGFVPDIDCKDCSTPPKQKCADGYIMRPSFIYHNSKECTKIGCLRPSGNQKSY